MLIRSAEQDIERVIYTEKAIAARVEEIGAELTRRLGDKRPVLVCVLKGASFFYIDLCRCMNCDVVIVEDIIDSGLTMHYLKELLSARKPASITTVSFLDKATCHDKSLKTDICGFEIPDEFVVGYGLDYANYYRNLPYIGILRPECYK